MANSLNIDLEVGQKVVLSAKEWKGTEAERTVEVLGGFGLQDSTNGSALFVRFPDGEETRASGYDIEKLVS